MSRVKDLNVMASHDDDLMNISKDIDIITDVDERCRENDIMAVVKCRRQLTDLERYLIYQFIATKLRNDTDIVSFENELR